jgi:hypothetical protein
METEAYFRGSIYDRFFGFPFLSDRGGGDCGHRTRGLKAHG